MKVIKVCMFVSRFLPQYSGAAIQCYSLLRELKKRKVEAFVISFSNDRKEPKYSIDGISVETIFVNQKGTIKDKIKEMIKIFLTIYRNRSKIDILHIHCLSLSSLLAGFILRKRIIQKLTLMGEDDIVTIKKHKLGIIKLLLMSKVNQIVSVSPALTDTLRNSKYFHNYDEVPNGVNTKIFRPVKNKYEKFEYREKLLLPVNAKIALFMGAIIDRKGIDVLIEAWNKVSLKYGKQLQLLLVGPEYIEGNSEFSVSFNRKLHKTISCLKLESKIKFVGEVKNPEKYLMCSDVFLFPSRREGLPNVLLEAMSCGLPCVVSRIPQITDHIIDHGLNGYLCEQEDIESMAGNILKLFMDKELFVKIGAAARKTIENRYDIANIADTYKGMYRNLLL
ncbi:MAG: glycosyltransferase family 4 protein [bacterium]